MKKKFGGFEMKPIFRLLVAMSIIAFAAGIMAVSCDKDAGGGNNNNNNNSGGGGNGGGGDNPVDLGPVAPELKITANQAAVAANLVKIEANGDVKINATKLAADTEPYGVNTDALTSASNAAYLIDQKSVNIPALFDIELMRNSTNAAEGGIVLVVPGSATGTNANNIALKNVADSLTAANGTGGGATDLRGVWKRSDSTAGANFFQLVSYMRSFGNGASANASGLGRLICPTAKLEKVHDGATATDATKLPFAKATCYIGVYNNDPTSAAYEINDRWVDDPSTEKMATFRVMGIYTGDTGLGALSGATGWDKSSFFGAQDNAAMQAIITKNKYVDKTFKITFVKSSGF